MLSYEALLERVKQMGRVFTCMGLAKGGIATITEKSSRERRSEKADQEEGRKVKVFRRSASVSGM